MTYNYDRVIEAAVFKQFCASRRTRHELEDRFQRLVNNGLNTMRETLETVDTTRFGIVKMHGMIGTLWDRPRHQDGLRARAPIEGFGTVLVDDELITEFDRRTNEESPTMIVFPWEVDRTHEDCRRFMEETNRAAAEYLAHARVLVVAGYSFPELNRSRFKSVLERATNLGRIEVVDPSEAAARHAREAVALARLDCNVEWTQATWPPRDARA